MLFRLCLAGGYPHPRYLRQCLTSRDIAEWEAYSRIEPFGPVVQDIQQAQIAREAANSNPYRSAPAQLTHFMLSHHDREQTAEEIYAAIRGR